MVILLTGLYSLNMLSLTAAKKHGADGGSGNRTFHFEYVTVTLLQELFKLMVAFACYQGESLRSKGRRRTVFQPRVFLRFGIPGVLNCFDMNFQYVILRFLQPAELAVLWNFKIFATVVLLHACLHHRFSWTQWTAMIGLVFGCALTQVADLSRGLKATPPAAAADAPSKLLGAGLALLGSSVAASSNVYCEWLVKQHPEDSIHFQNMQLYIFGIVLNLVTLMCKAALQPDNPVNGSGGLIAGYTCWVWLIVFLGGVAGIGVSFALKYVDNLAVAFAHVISIFVVAAASTKLFGVTLSGSFLKGGAIVLFALIAFHSAEHQHGKGSARGTSSASGDGAEWPCDFSHIAGLRGCLQQERRSAADWVSWRLDGENKDLSTWGVPMYCITQMQS